MAVIQVENDGKVEPAMHKSELHGLWLAKNCVAFFSTSLSSRSTRFSRRSRSFSRARSACGAETKSLGRYCDTHLPSVDLPIPTSDAIRSRGTPIVHLLLRALIAQVTGTKSLQVQPLWSSRNVFFCRRQPDMIMRAGAGLQGSGWPGRGTTPIRSTRHQVHLPRDNALWCVVPCLKLMLASRSPQGLSEWFD